MSDTLLKDLRFALRWLRRSPGFTLVAVASLAVGIGFNTALFSVVDAVLLRPLPVRDPDRLVDVYTAGGPQGDAYATSSYPDFLDLRAQNAVFEDMLGFSPMFAIQTLGDRSRLVLGEVVTGNYFQMLGITAEAGRMLLPGDDRAGAARVVVVSDRYWRREWGGEASAIGRTVTLRGQAFQVVGVAPAWFTGMLPVLAPEMWVPLARVEEVEPAGISQSVPSPTGATPLERRGDRWMFVKGRLKAGATVAQARSNLDLLMDRLAVAWPQTNRDRHVALVATRDVRILPDATPVVRSASLGLMTVVGLGLLIACANVAGMLLARASARQREIAIRLAIGASRGRLVRQLLTESAVLALLGGAAGVGLAWWLIRVATTTRLPIPIPLSLDLRLDARVLAFTLALTACASLAAGLLPALKSSRASLVEPLRARAGTSRGHRWSLRDLLVAGQMAITMVLLVSAGLLARSLAASARADVGFRTHGLAVLSADPGMAGYDAERSRQFWKRALARVQALPGVESVALGDRVPFSLGFSETPFFIPGVQQPRDRPITILTSGVSPDYFTTLGVRILEGRAFTAADTPRTVPVVVINEAMARRYWPRESAVGKTVRLRSVDGQALQVIGVCADYRVRTVGEDRAPYLHFAQSQRERTHAVLVARTRGDAGQLLANLRRELLAIEPAVVFIDNQTMDAQIATTLFPVTAIAWVLGIVGLVALMLGAIGLYGTIAYAVGCRTREIGIRMALGARPRAVLGVVMRQGMTVAGTGLAAGCFLAVGATRLLSGLLYGVTMTDAVAWCSAAVVLVAVAAIANLVPARRAAGVDPSIALRAE